MLGVIVCVLVCCEFDHAPDIILRDFDKAGTYVLIDIKTLDAAGPSHVAAHHTDRARLTAHLAIAHSLTSPSWGSPS